MKLLFITGILFICFITDINAAPCQGACPTSCCLRNSCETQSPGCSSPTIPPQPTTASPTTKSPTTNAPTTTQPTQPSVPTTSSPTTRSPITNAPTTRSPTSAQSCGRHRKPWSTLDATERQLYIDGWEQLGVNTNIMQTFSKTHNDLFTTAIHNDPMFGPWHRAFLYDVETHFRDLGPRWSCFSMPYWDWSNEPTPTDVTNGETLFIINSGLGGDSNNQCIDDGSLFDKDTYTPFERINLNLPQCLIRNIDWYQGGDSSCVLESPQQLLAAIVGYPKHRDYTERLEVLAHNRPHNCIGGHMAQRPSPDDPIFFMHHAFIDYLWALWQNCHNYDGIIPNRKGDEYWGNLNAQLTYIHTPVTPIFRVSQVLNMPDLDVTYEKGPFWINANVDNNCANVNGNWFKDTARRRMQSTTRSDRAKEILAELQKTIPNQQQRLKEWAYEVCKYEQEREFGEICVPPAAFEDCSNMEINLSTNDIDITLEELLAKNGLTECQIRTRKDWYEFASNANMLLKLCTGCFDPFCNNNQILDRCGDINRGNSNNNGGHDPGAVFVDEKQVEGEHDIVNKFNQKNVKVLLATVVLIGLILV